MDNLPENDIGFVHQQSVHGRGVRPDNVFTRFKKEDIEQSIPSRFEDQADKFPDRIAIKTIHQEITYKSLNQTANGIARAILKQRGKEVEPIALVLENGISMIAAILGVLKAGKMYVPLDSSLPRERIEYILGDSQAESVVTNNENSAFANELADNTLQLINIDQLDSNLSLENLGLSISPDTIAWIIYTSGSTGNPKGVVQTHRNLLHFVMNYINGFHLCAEDRITLFYSCSVNAGNHDLFSAMLSGASLYPWDIKEEGLTGLADYLIGEGITIYSSVPTVLLHFFETLTGEEKFPALRLIRMGGELVNMRHVQLYKRHFSEKCIFVNRFGSTETGSTRWYFVGQKTRIVGSNVPVGYPVENNEILLLNDIKEDVEFGQVGEIAVKSKYLSPGYWRRPDLTQAAFLPDPDGGDERIYLTGDLGRMMPDGSLVHLGRKDFQIKIRGYRIETAEVEMALLGHVSVKETAVRVHETHPGKKILVAYIVSSAQKAPTVTNLRQFLEKTLPIYMIPSNFVLLDSMPILPGGKVNYRALPPPGRSRPNLDNPYEPYRTPMEKDLVEIWAKVLDLDQVGITDNFFDLGGHSLLATQVIARVINAFRVNVTLKSLFQASTVADMAVVITQKIADKVENKDIERLLAELEKLSDGDARRHFAVERIKGESSDGRS